LSHIVAAIMCEYHWDLLYPPRNSRTAVAKEQ
jgi:hypothetical protein